MRSFDSLSNLYINEEEKRFGQTVTATARPYVSENDDNPLLAPDLINNHEIPATMQTITLKNYSIDEIMEGKQGHTTIKTSCKYQENQHTGHVLYNNQSDMCTHY